MTSGCHLFEDTKLIILKEFNTESTLSNSKVGKKERAACATALHQKPKL
jgi:hypothetical protein